MFNYKKNFKTFKQLNRNLVAPTISTNHFSTLLKYMKKAYLKYQLFYLLIASFAFGYSLFIYSQNINFEDLPSENHIITKLNCSYAPRVLSSIWIKKNNKVYSITLPEKECSNHYVGETVELKYNKQFDYYLIVEKGGDSFRLITTGLAFFLLILPWGYIKDRFKML